MKIRISDEPVERPPRGRPSFDYSIFSTEAVVRIEGKDYEKIRIKANNMVAGARKHGYSVRSHVVTRGGIHIGSVTRKEPV